MKSNNLTEGKIGPLLLRFAFPFLISSLLQALYGATDLFVVGKFNNSSAVTAVAIGSQVMQTITGIILGISMGGTVLIGRCVGEKNRDGIVKAIGTLLSLLFIVAIILTPVMAFCTNTSVSLMNTPAEAIEYTKKYILICACGIPFIIGYNAVSSIFRGLGDSKSPVFFITIACIVNAALNFILVGGLKLGAAGSAFATIAAQAVSFIIAVIYMNKKEFKFNKKYFRIDKYSFVYILKVGFPLALQDGLVNISFLVITAIINTMGLVASASVGVVEKIIVFAMLPSSAFASAVAAMTAQNIGAGKPKRAERVLRYGIVYSLIFGVMVCMYSQYLPQSLTSIFTRDTDVVKVAAEYLRSYSIDCILVSFIFCMNAYFSGCGKSVISLIHRLIATFGVRIPLSYILSHKAKITLYGMGFAAPAASIVSICICFGYFFWQTRKFECISNDIAIINH